MRIKEILSELAFHGSKCTKDCSGHTAGYKWAMNKNSPQPCQSSNPSFNKGCDIANNQLTTGNIKNPKVRDDRGRFANKPKMPNKFNK